VLADRTAGAAGANSGETDAHSSEEETDMTSMAPTMGRGSGRLRLAVAGAVVLHTFDGPAGTLLLPSDLNNRGQIVDSMSTDGATARGFLLARGVNGPFTPISVPGAPSTLAFGLNDRGQITGTYNNPNAAPSPPPATAPPMGPMG
jgi:hypothetical protein